MNPTVAKAAAMIPVILAAALFFGAIFLDVVLIRRWRGWWRGAACLPIAVLVAWAVFIVVSILREPSSHNLWPLELILWAAGALAALGLLALLKRITHK
jgi:hypothetical protein